jgi:SNF2 family DNA or RNA helicase
MALKYVDFNLFDFQAEEVERLYKQKSRLLAWEMGTGKTYGGIALDLQNRGRSIDKVGPGARKTLIVCPKSVLDVWDQHCMDLTDLDVYVIDSKNRTQFIKDVTREGKNGYFICHWEALRLMPELQKVKFFHIIADECHRAKNRKAQQTRALKKIPTLYKTALSGTPADNKPHDLWSILNWLWPTVYTSYWKFEGAYVIKEMTPQGYSKITGVKNIEHLRNQMGPWYSRKLKKDVLKDLPDKYYSTIWVELDPKQRKAYKQMENTMVAWVAENEEDIENPIIAQAVIAQLIRLQQFAVGYMTPKLDDDGNQIFGKPYTTKSGVDKPGPPLFEMTEPSSKLDALMEILEDNPDEQIVVFSQFKSVISLLARRLEERHITHGIYTGDTSQADRGNIVQEFQSGRLRVFAGTVAAGGVGITLTNSSTVVFLDRSWSPALNAQAEDRLHRIGQQEAVQVIDIMAKGTVDIGRRLMLEQKMEWLREILGDRVVRMLERKGFDNVIE